MAIRFSGGHSFLRRPFVSPAAIRFSGILRYLSPKTISSKRKFSCLWIWGGTAEATVHKKSFKIAPQVKPEQRKRGSCESCERKNRFMAIVSHELRNMLAPVVMALDVYSRTAADEHDPELIQI